MKRRFALALAFSLALAAGCARKGEERGKALSKSPVAAMTQVNEAMQKAAKAAQDAAKQEPVPAVKPEALLPFLPPTPTGWTAGDARGETSQATGFEISAVRRSYQGPGTLEATITDSGYHPMVTAAVTMAAQFARESAEGYERGVTLDGNPGVERWRRDGSRAELAVVAGKRYLVTLRASHVPEGFLRSVWESMDRSGLSALK